MPFERKLARSQINYVNNEINEYTNHFLIDEGRSITYAEIQDFIKQHNIKSPLISIVCGSYTFTLHRVCEPVSTNHGATYMGIDVNLPVNGKILSLVVINPLSELETITYPYSINIATGAVTDISEQSPNLGGSDALIKW